MDEQLQKIAMNTAHPGEQKHLRSLEHMKQREMVKDFRYPGRVNAHIMAKEYPYGLPGLGPGKL